MRAGNGALRRLALAGLALPALLGACGWPGSDQVAAAVRCLARPQAPPPLAAPLPAVWRTHSMPGVGYSIDLPDNWDGVALGTDNQESRLAAAAQRSPALGDTLGKLVGEGSLLSYGPAAYLAISTEGGRLDVGLTLGARYAISCAGAPLVDARSSADNPGQIRQTHFPAGDSRVLTYDDTSVVDGVSEPYENWLFALGAPGGQDLLLLFSSYRPGAQAAWPVVWAAMTSLRRAPPADVNGLDPQPACLFPDPRARELSAANRAPCAVPLGPRLAESDCGPAPADPDRPMNATIVPLTGGDGTPARGGSMSSGCVFGMPARSAVWLGAGKQGADLVAYVDLRFPPTGRPIASIDMRQHGGQALSATTTLDGSLLLTEYGVGGAPATSLSVTVLAPESRVHRLVLSAVGSRLRAWLDGAETVAPVYTHVVQPGTAGIYLTTEDMGSNIFTVLAAAVYAAG